MEAHVDRPEAPKSETGSKPVGKDDLQTLPLAEVEKKLGSSPDGLTQAEAQKRLTQYGPNEIEEKKTNELLKFLSYFWGPIPWMIEAAVILSAVARHWPDFGIILASASRQRRGRILGRTPGGQRHRRPEGDAGDQGPGETRREVDQPGGARTGAGRRHPLAPGRHRAGRCALAGRRRGVGGSVGADRGIACPPRANPATRSSPVRSFVTAKSTRWSMPPAAKPISARRRNWCETADTVSHFQQAVLKIGNYLIILAVILVAVIIGRRDLPRRPDPHHVAVRAGADRGRDPRGDADGAVGDDGGRRAPARQETGDREQTGRDRGIGGRGRAVRRQDRHADPEQADAGRSVLPGQRSPPIKLILAGALASRADEQRHDRSGRARRPEGQAGAEALSGHPFQAVRSGAQAHRGHGQGRGRKDIQGDQGRAAGHPGAVGQRGRGEVRRRQGGQRLRRARLSFARRGARRRRRQMAVSRRVAAVRSAARRRQGHRRDRGCRWA